MEIKANIGCCEEAALFPVGLSFYVPCNEPAVNIVGWKGRSDIPVPMCEKCTFHNIKNRGGQIIGPYEKENEIG